MSHGDRMAPFKAADHLGFWVGGTPYSLASGQYGSGEGALVVLAVDGEVEGKLTVSLKSYGAPELAPGELYVRLGDGHDHFRKIHHALLELGVFEATEQYVKQGFVDRYAEVWRFVRCIADDHPGRTIDYAVECRDCRRSFDAVYEQGKTDLLARDAVKVIRAMGKAGW